VGISNSRAEYLRNYRAARREQRPEHICENCGNSFQSRRSDARFCSAACRAAHWRPISHHALQQHTPGKQTCIHQTGPSSFCGQAATWRHDQVRNDARNLTLHGYYCDKHVRARVPADVTVGEPIRKVIERHARADRRRPGKRAE
jgi:hypothetical protein